MPEIRSALFRQLAICCLGLSALALPVLAQERLPFRQGPNGAALDGAVYVKPGALLLATFDTNQDFQITEAEIEAGARQTFKIADADQDGFMSPLEQREWASRIGSDADVIANPTTFPSALPAQVTEDEFVFGLQTFAQRFETPVSDDSEETEILIRNFTFEPERTRPVEDNVKDDIERLRRPVISDRRQTNGMR